MAIIRIPHALRAAGWFTILLSAPVARAQDSTSIHGRVVDGSGAPLANAVVAFRNTRLQTATASDGQFSVRAPHAGLHRLRVTLLGYRPVDLEVALPEDASRPLEIQLERTAVALRGLTVFGSAEELAELEERLWETPGSVSLVRSAELRSTRQANLADVLRFTPGVYVQPRFGAADESQLSVRGSGLRNNFHLRGVNILVNGMPYRNADGFTDFESLELLTADNIQVFKGANALRYGGSTLGGAINLETRTGYNAEPVQAFAQGGAFGFAKIQASSGAVLGDLDYYASYARTHVDGYREYAGQARDRVNAHLGYVLSPRVDARVFYFFADVNEELPGSLTREELRSDPRAANPQNVANRWGRDYTLHHVGLQLRAQLSPAQRLEIAPYGQFRDIVHPIFRVLDQTSRDVGAEIRYENTATFAGRRNRLTVGFQPAVGRTDNRHFDNVAGERGELRKNQTEEAGTLGVYLEDVLALGARLSLVAGARFDRALRRIEDHFPDDGDQSDERHYQAFMPRAGLLYDLAGGAQLFANASRTFEPPLLLELNSFTQPGFVDLAPQDAWQFEAGTRGRAGGLSWEVALFDIELRDEIININVQPFSGAPFTVPTYRNAERSRHFGVEAGVAGTVRSLLARDDRVAARVAYTLGRYEFVRDAAYSGNEIPGIPEHVVQAELRYEHPSGLSLRPNVEWVPADYFVNSENSATNGGWLVLGVRAEWDLPRLGTVAFIEVRNLTDASYSPAVNGDDAGSHFFQPADGRSLYAGVRWRR